MNIVNLFVGDVMISCCWNGDCWVRIELKIIFIWC